MALAAPEAKGAPHPTGALHHELESDRIATRTDLADSARSRGPSRPCRVSRRLFSPSTAKRISQGLARARRHPQRWSPDSGSRPTRPVRVRSHGHQSGREPYPSRYDEAYSSADFRHGPMAMVEPGFPAVVICARGPLLDDLRSSVGMLEASQASVLVITDDPQAAAASPSLLVRSDVPEWLSPAILVVPGQLLALHLAALRGHDVDAPRTIRKITETY